MAQLTGNYTRQAFNLLLVGLFGYFSYLMLRLTLEYVPIQSDVSFLMIKQTEVESRPEYLPIFYTHVYSSIFVLFSGFFAIIRKQFKLKNFHKINGYIYVIGILLFAAPSGIYMACFANGGWPSIISFLILGGLWMFTTYKAFISAKNKKFKQHKLWMWRSFALTLSAITLRLWKVILVYLFHPPPMDVYKVVAWLGWVLNLLVIEFLIDKKVIK